MDPDKYKEEKATLIGAAVAAGVIVWLILWLGIKVHVALAAIIGVAASFCYVFLAAGAVEAFVSIRSWGYCGKVDRPPDNDILVIAALWPFTLFGGGLIYTFIGIINRKF